MLRFISFPRRLVLDTITALPCQVFTILSMGTQIKYGGYIKLRLEKTVTMVKKYLQLKTRHLVEDCSV